MKTLYHCHSSARRYFNAMSLRFDKAFPSQLHWSSCDVVVLRVAWYVALPPAVRAGIVDHTPLERSAARCRITSRLHRLYSSVLIGKTLPCFGVTCVYIFPLKLNANRVLQNEREWWMSNGSSRKWTYKFPVQIMTWYNSKAERERGHDYVQPIK